MIRNVIVCRFKAGTTRAQVQQLVDAMNQLRIPGMLHLECGVDLGLKDGNWDYALTADFEDRQSYQAYDLDPEHNRIRRELAADITETVVRVQFELTG